MNTIEKISFVAQAKNPAERLKRAKNAIAAVNDLFDKIAGLEAEKNSLESGLAAASADVRFHFGRAAELERKIAAGGQPIPIRLNCAFCGQLHIDEGEFATKPHHTHACQFCGGVWRPAIVPTVGVLFLPGLKNKAGDQ